MSAPASPLSSTSLPSSPKIRPELSDSSLRSTPSSETLSTLFVPIESSRMSRFVTSPSTMSSEKTVLTPSSATALPVPRARKSAMVAVTLA